LLLLICCGEALAARIWFLLEQRFSSHATQKVNPRAVEGLAESNEHFHSRIGCSRFNSLKLPPIYSGLIGKFFLRQSHRHP